MIQLLDNCMKLVLELNFWLFDQLQELEFIIKVMFSSLEAYYMQKYEFNHQILLTW